MNDQEKCKYEEIKDYKSAFECFKQRFLVEKRSIFDLENKDTILKKESIKYIFENFINVGFSGNMDFNKKIEYQLITKPSKPEEDIEIINNSIEILATAIWLWRIVPSNAIMDATKNGIHNILNLRTPKLQIDSSNQFFNKGIKGIAKTGTYYNTNKPFELAFIIKFLSDYLENEDAGNAKKTEVETLKAIKYNNKSGYMQILNNDNGNHFVFNEKDDEPIIKKLEAKDIDPVKLVAIYNALLFFFSPSQYEPIISNGHKERIVKNLNKYWNDMDDIYDIDQKLLEIKKNMIKEGFIEKEHFFYQQEVREKWDPTILPAKNVIYYGAPGTGKTYNIKKLVEAKVKAQCEDGEDISKYYEVVQFHPSYGYEDFIDGIKPTGISENGNIQLELKNGIFKEMCIKAFKELERFEKLSDAEKMEQKEPKNFYFIADEINRAELSRVFGELLLCIEEDKRLGFDGNSELKEMNLIKTQNYSLWEEKHAVVKLDLHNAEDNGYRFGVPENIYFLATMNDIDKSIDSFDLALRRRFKWVHKSCDYDVIYNHLSDKADENSLSEYVSDRNENIGGCNKLNNYISNKLNLGESYEIGHSYFMNVKVHGGKISQSACENLFELELAPLISEYLRAEIQDPNDLKKELKKMKNIFVGK